MNLSQEFISAVEENNLIKVKVMIKDSLVIDPTFQEVDEYIKYASKNIPDLFNNQDDEVFIQDSSKWDKEYMNSQLNKLMYNFSKERINHIKDICKKIYSERRVKIEENRSNEGNNVRIVGTEKIAVGTSLVGVATIAAGVICSKSILTVGGAALLIGGGVAYINEVSKK